jgi:hypothetical protein
MGQHQYLSAITGVQCRTVHQDATYLGEFLDETNLEVLGCNKEQIDYQ